MRTLRFSLRGAARPLITYFAIALLAASFAPSSARAQSPGKTKPPAPSTTKPAPTSAKEMLVCLPDDPDCFPVPWVTPDGASVTVSPGANSYTFTVENVGSHGGSVQYSATCSGAVSGCTVSPSTAFLGVGESETVSVSYTGASSGGGGYVELKAASQSDWNVDYGAVSVTVQAPPSYTVSVTPDAGSVAIEPGTTSYGFTVQNTGNQNTTYNLTPTCSGVATGCSAPASVTLGPGASTTVSVGYSAVTRGGTGSVSLSD